MLIRVGHITAGGCFALENARMNSASRSFTIRNHQDPFSDHVSAFRIALDRFGTAELSEFLPPRDHAKYLEILSELVRIELAHDSQLGKTTSMESYRDRYPDLFANPVPTCQTMPEAGDVRQQTGENSITRVNRGRADSLVPKGAAPISFLDPAVSSKYDVMLPPDCSENYPATARPVQNHAPSSSPNAEIGQTRLGPAKDKKHLHASEPEVVCKFTEAMLEMPKAGDEFLGFRLLAELGKGAFGKVFLAQQGQLAGRLVALKIATGLFSESQTLAQLQHTYIVPIYSYHHGQSYQAVCMPYLGSTTLAHVLADIRTKSMPSSGKELLSTLNDRKKSTRRSEDSSKDSTAFPSQVQPAAGADVAAPVPPATTPARALALEGLNYVDSILWLAVRLADGLAHAHEQGIIHRDLKPANILLTDDGLPMLLDFNLAQDNKVRGTGAAASIGGTLPYMAPEHLEAFRGNAMPVDARSDLYSFGVILFELLTGAAPFPSYRKLSTRETVNRMIHDRLQSAPRLRCLNKSIPPAVEAIVRRCLEADPALRYQTVRQLQEDLQCQLEQKPLRHTANPSIWERCQKFRKRHPRLISVTSVVVAFCLLIAGMASAFAVREEQLRRLEAKGMLSRFHVKADTAEYLLVSTDKVRREEGRLLGHSTLDCYQVLQNPDWRQAPTVQRLPERDRVLLQKEVGELLMLLAHEQKLAGKDESNPTRKEELARQGLQFCSLATDCFGDEHIPTALWKLQSKLHGQLKDQDMVQQCEERAAKQAKFRSVRDRYMTAWLLVEEGKFREALPLLNEAIRLKPKDFHLHHLQAVCHDNLAMYAEAISCYRACIALRPDSHMAYLNRGLSYLKQGNYELARADFDQVVRMNPDFVETYVYRAMALEGLKKYADAIGDVTEAIDRGDTQTRLYFLRAKFRADAGDPEGAKKDLAEGLRREPADEHSWVARGIAYLKVEPAEPELALCDFEKALKLNHRSLPALHNKAVVLGKYFKRTKEAVETLTIAVELYPDDVRPLAGRGLYHARLGNRAAAIKDAELAILLDTEPANLYMVACIYSLTSKQEPDDRREALHYLSAALKRGYGFEHLENDGDLAPIRDSAVFRQGVQVWRAMQEVAARKRP
jgi:serine/threonine protein kinase/tetratricopeptide (TPR) repeat protein